MFILLTTGYRDWKDEDRVYYECDQKVRSQRDDIPLVLHGGARGADWFVDKWARFHEYPCLTWPARWQHGGKGKAEGPMRNEEMVQFAVQWVAEGHGVECLAFLDPESKGTVDCISRIAAYPNLAENLTIVEA